MSAFKKMDDALEVSFLLKRIASAKERISEIREQNGWSQSNFETIQSMTKEELAEFLDGVQREENLNAHEEGLSEFESCKNGWIAWLEKDTEYEDVDDEAAHG